MSYINPLRWAIFIGLCALPLVSFIIADAVHFPTNMFFPYITGKNFTFRIIVEIVCALYILLAIRQPKYRPRASLLMWSFGGFVAWMCIATLTSVDADKSFWSNFERMDGYITLIHLFMLFIVAGAVLTADTMWKRFFQFSVGVSMVQGVYALLQAFELFGFHPSSQSGARADTTFGNATYLAVFMLFNFFITLYLMVRERNLSVRTIYCIALVLQFLGLFFTQSRGPLLGLVGGLVIAAIYVALFAKGSEWKGLRKISFWGLGAIAVVVVLFFALKNTPIVQQTQTLNRIASISLTDRTTQARFLIWNSALQGVQERPLTGWGQENFSYVFNKYYQPSMYDQEQWFDRAHNEFLDWAIAGGIPAFLLYISLFILAAWTLYRSQLSVPEQALFLGLLTGYAFNNLFVFDNLVSYMYFIAILAFIHGSIERGPHKWMFMSRSLDDRAVAIAAPVVLVALVWGGYALNGPGMARAQNLIHAITPSTAQGQKTAEQKLTDFKVVLTPGGLGYQESVEQLFQYTSTQVAPSSLSPDDKQKAYTLTRESGDKLLAQRKGDARLELFYANFLGQFGQADESMNYLTRALEHSPKKQQILFQIASLYVMKKDTRGAIAPLKEAYESAPAYEQAFTLYVSGLMLDNQFAAADKLLMERYNTTAPDNEQLMQTYLNLKRYDRLKTIYDARVAANKDDINSRVAQAVLTYFISGSKAAGVAALQQIIKDNPTIGTQIQPIIDQINNDTLKP